MSIYRRKSGRYAVLIDLEPSAAGLRRRKSVGTYRTRKEAESAERKALEARDRGIDLSPKTVTVSELLDRYLSDREALGRGAKTLQEYRSCACTFHRRTPWRTVRVILGRLRRRSERAYDPAFTLTNPRGNKD